MPSPIGVADLSAGALIPQRGDPVLDRLDHGLTIETGVAHCRIIVVARLVSPVFRVFLAALSADVRMIRSHRRLLGTRLTRNINPAKTHYTQIAGRWSGNSSQ